jgi:hypothetical protein
MWVMNGYQHWYHGGVPIKLAPTMNQLLVKGRVVHHQSIHFLLFDGWWLLDNSSIPGTTLTWISFVIPGSVCSRDIPENLTHIFR